LSELETFLTAAVIVLLSGLALVAVLVARLAHDLKKTLRRLDLQVQSLKTELARQEDSLAKMRLVLSQRPEDPFVNLFDSIERFRSRGALAAAVMLGTRLFRAYLARRPRKKALPNNPRPEETT
jgi:hypothetical protein